MYSHTYARAYNVWERVLACAYVTCACVDCMGTSFEYERDGARGEEEERRWRGVDTLSPDTTATMKMFSR